MHRVSLPFCASPISFFFLSRATFDTKNHHLLLRAFHLVDNESMNFVPDFEAAQSFGVSWAPNGGISNYSHDGLIDKHGGLEYGEGSGFKFLGFILLLASK